ncbi:DUF2567 domain-containing protein [Candidatus Blastococcus massiliensis]|uniref:DUF2567 domain-containing protein n=1 Tax=Candidatus Blastococcus massiliensis TaxID=1470358 RepID=UPI0006859932|nr:DUF2567 domain-containing protein [Candidatus Blastococcus massiliensis]
MPAPSDYWRGWAETREDLPRAGWFLLAVTLAGVPAGVIWWALAPRAEFRITEDGPAPIGVPSAELLIADDGVFVLVLATLGLFAGLAAWAMRKARGVTLVVTLAVGTVLAGAVAWWVGVLLGEGPTDAQLAEVGGVVTTRLDLGSTAALAVAPFVAVLVYLLGVILNADDGLGRPVPVPDANSDASPAPAADAPVLPPLVETPPARH